MNILKIMLLFKNFLLGNYARSSYSQEGEDLIIERIFENKNHGFYIDVGAHHPLRFSNTYLLYKKGWSGINIDATPHSMDSFKLLRPRDINLEIGIGTKKETKTFYQFNEPALNTFDKSLISHNIQVGYKLISKTKIQLVPLRDIIKKYAINKTVDLLTIDIEGLDFEALKSMNWSHKPIVIIIEQLFSDLNSVLRSDSHKNMIKLGYHLYAKTINSLIYRLK